MGIRGTWRTLGDVRSALARTGALSRLRSFRPGRRGVLAGALIMVVLALVVSPPMLDVASGVTYQRHAAHHHHRGPVTTTTSLAISRSTTT
ncbi:MAG TPA: hypothetical protein VMU64_09510, partial [Acidimicrobiales bacterium]|nr:hypothetical protein [Acidimicrobiales bacterium]